MLLRRTCRSRSGSAAVPGRGQILVLFVLLLMVLVAGAGLLVDGSMAWVNRRLAQSAADTAAIAAAKSYTKSSDPVQASAAAAAVAAANGFPGDLVACDGRPLSGQGVTVTHPPLRGRHLGDIDFVEVKVTRRMRTGFAALLGQSCWLVSASAVAQTRPARSSGPAILSLDTNCANVGIKWNGHRNTVLSGDVVSNSFIDTNGDWGSVTPPGVMTQRCPSSQSPPEAHLVSAITPDPFTFTTADFTCQSGPLPANLEFAVATIPPGTYCATVSITVKAATPKVTGTVTLIAPNITFNANPMDLRPHANGVLAWATAAGSKAINFKAADAVWSGILYAPNGAIHIVSKANEVITGNIWARTVELGGDDWSISGRVEAASDPSDAVVKLVE